MSPTQPAEQTATKARGQVNDLPEVGPPARGPGLLMRASSRTAIKDGLDTMMES